MQTVIQYACNLKLVACFFFSLMAFLGIEYDIIANMLYCLRRQCYNITMYLCMTIDQYLNIVGRKQRDASLHRDLASPHRYLASPHRDLVTPLTRFKRWMIRRKRVS